MNPIMHRRHFLLAAAAGGIALLPAPVACAQDKRPPARLDVPYVPTPQDVVDRMLELAHVAKSDYLIDLGCGDGRIVVSAAREFGAQGLGIDLNPERITEARANAKKAGVGTRVDFRIANLFETDLSRASVVTLYLLPDVNVKLRPKLWQQLKVGSRVVSHAFDMGPEWPPERTEDVGGRTIHMWTIGPAQKAPAADGGRSRA
ncbi:class I SAM-dependent methyltransferase [Massilia sp. YIM B02763]|uniref:SAM-dependent methyltransferase n=1 Tax=Massilia sp. YIM B02763 TaxID=3050130 RepID=UPI0025B62E97|nr:class I SAM-dependent methyltransferase [Massilia sp. YIM B02763]MDN4054877.1 class I SAM-dependent methyltransferase [Massilia sp. YIM B02763]